MSAMTMEQIRAMFAPGQQWKASRTPGFRGEAQTVAVRTITKVRSKDYICTTPDKPTQNLYGMFPTRAADVIEARDGYLKFNLVHAADKARATIAVIELQRVAA